jgi:glycosyltransferase involved in cell wall biosynthesis
MKILFVNSLYAPDLKGGAERSVKKLAELHGQAGDEVTVLTTHGGQGTVSEVVDGVRVHRLSAHNLYWLNQPDQPSAVQRALWHGIDSFNPGMYMEVRRWIRQIQPDVISAQNLSGLSVAVWQAAREQGVPVVQVLRDYYGLCPKTTMQRDGHNCVSVCGSCRAMRLPHRALAHHLSAVVGCSRAVLDKHLAHGLYNDVPVKAVIHNAQQMAEVTLPSSPPLPTVLAYIGALSEVKGVEALIGAFQQVQAASEAPLQLLVSGRGQARFEAHLQRTYASDTIRFMGHVEPGELFRQAHVAIVPSTWDDPLPGVVFQALAHHAPVIASCRGGIPEMVRDGVNGLLFDPALSGDLAHAMTRMLNAPGLWQGMRQVARASVAHFLDEQRLLRAYQTLYRQVAAP